MTTHLNAPSPPRSDHDETDPTRRNDQRTACADLAVRSFQQGTGNDEEALIDLLANLMHWADRNHYDFDLALLHAEHHYDAEKLEETE
jgi:hypothetical protein